MNASTRSENIDVSLSVPNHLQNGFSNMTEQNFHTPSFGDEDFDIPPINPHHNSGPQHMPYHPPPISMPPMSQTTMTMSDQSTAYHQPLYLSPPQEHNMGMGMNNYNQQNGYRMPQNSLAQLQQYSMGPPQGTMRSPQGRQAQSPQGTMPHETTTTSDDSDDSTPHSHLVAGMKRPSPEPAENSLAKIQKKPKTQKKKKKRDPNEPQKPVSAYALFFRDTQAAIKGQNPNASFGEVSKIVASMWDALDAEHKNVYKKKTEAAKKDYLKALAAYRASLVSKGGGEQEPIYGGYGGYGGGGGGGGGGGAYNGYSPPTGLPSPPISAPSPQGHIKKPHMMPDNRQPQPTMQQVMMGHMGQQQQQQQQHLQQQPPQQQQQQQQQQPPPNPQQVNQNSNYMQQQQAGGSGPSGEQPMSDQLTAQTPNNHCIRSGCPNPAVANSEWEDEYCSNECVVTHCKDVFSSWVASNQNSAVK
ncbi:thymocyte selection-associated high mobility group box protein TOX-like isoform X2 [Cimex lectularius]|uniref:HMG box domain-containing protein n=1 Tax=Cimex lectularius TaxID=79782 RepID=A0A8I6TKV0_CIMLE|nr:thymocyte selection-associated high mobility group box protein TOX-like isoform X2 [Cimex lectularius]